MAAKKQLKELPTDAARSAEISALFEGRTVDRVEILGLNSWRFHFKKGAAVTIDTYAMGMGIYGPDIVD